jgi:hypothetical protein
MMMDFETAKFIGPPAVFSRKVRQNVQLFSYRPIVLRLYTLSSF